MSGLTGHLDHTLTADSFVRFAADLGDSPGRLSPIAPDSIALKIMPQKTELRDEILALHEKGYSKAEIAAIVQCSLVTVRKYVPKQDRVYSDLNQPTKAEMEVLSLMVQGLNSRGIAARRLVSPRTIESQISCLYAKSESNTYTQVINWGVQHGYCQYPDRADLRQDDRQETINVAIAAIDQLLLAESDQIQLEIAAIISARLKLTREMAIARIQAIAP